MITSSKEIRIETSTVCNYSCIMCPRDLFRRKKEVMENEIFFKIIDKITVDSDRFDTVTFSGFGEFSTDYHWKEKISYARSRFKKVIILTNCSLFNTEDLDFIIENVNTVKISLYASNEDTFYNVHRNNKITFKSVVDKIEYLVRNKKENSIHMNYIKFNGNKNQIDKWIKAWKNKADIIDVWTPHNWIYGRKYRDISEHRLVTCGRPFNGPVQVQVDGTLNVCCFDYNGEMIIGNLLNNSIEEIYNSKIMNEIQNLHNNNKADTLKLCQICDQRNNIESKKNELLFSTYSNSGDRIFLTSTDFKNFSK